MNTRKLTLNKRYSMKEVKTKSNNKSITKKRANEIAGLVDKNITLTLLFN